MTRAHALGCDLVKVPFVSLALALSVLACTRPMPPSSPSALLDAPAPAFTRASLDGQPTGTEGPRAVTVVKFFARWCEPCKRTLPAAEALHRERPELRMIGISEDDHPTEARELVQTYGLTFPVVHDRENALAGRFGVRDLPAAVVIDARGIVRWVGVGESADPRAAVDALR